VRQQIAENLRLVAHFLTVSRIGVETVRIEGLHETPVETTVRRPSLKELAKQVLDRQPIIGDTDTRRAICNAIEAARLTDFSAALMLGRLHLCANCAHFTIRARDPARPSVCAVFAEELLPLMPFYCARFEASPAPAALAFLPDPDGKLALDASSQSQSCHLSA
jgi:hypothetical protein